MEMLTKNRIAKQEKVAEIKEKMVNAKGIVLAAYQGNNAEADTLLRKSCRENGVEYKIYKNTLVKLAAKEAGIEGLDEYLTASTAVAFSYEDATASARVLNNFAKDHKNMQLKAGVVEGKVYDTETIAHIANIPSKEVLVAKLLGSLKAPLSNVVYLLNAIKESKEA